MKIAAARLALGNVAAGEVRGNAKADGGETGADTNLAPIVGAEVEEHHPHRQLADRRVHQSSSTPRWRIRCAIRDCSDHSSMNPGEAVWEKRPPDSANEARSAS